MVSWDKIEVVQAMQDYIRENVLKEEFTIEQMYQSVGYSKRHCDRIFKELLGKTPTEYVKAILISNSSQELLTTRKNILEVAMDSKFETHEGYTKAFLQTFHITPKEYRKTQKPIPLFIQYPIKSYYSYLYKKEELEMETETALCMISVMERPKRKLIFLRSKNATDYFSYCEEKGCDWEGLLNSIACKMDTAAILELPKEIIKEGYSHIAAGVEVPTEYTGEIPEGYEMVELKPCHMLYFESEPFQKEEDFFPAIESVFKAVNQYKPEQYGFIYADELAPRFNFGGDIGKGAKYAVPVKKIK